MSSKEKSVGTGGAGSLGRAMGMFVQRQVSVRRDNVREGTDHR